MRVSLQRSNLGRFADQRGKQFLQSWYVNGVQLEMDMQTFSVRIKDRFTILFHNHVPGFRQLEVLTLRSYRVKNTG